MAVRRIMDTLSKLMIGGKELNPHPYPHLNPHPNPHPNWKEAGEAVTNDRKAIGDMINLMTKPGGLVMEESSVMVLGSMSDDYSCHENLLQLNALGEVVAVMAKALQQKKIPINMAYRGTYMIWKLSDATTRKRDKEQMDLYRSIGRSNKAMDT